MTKDIFAPTVGETIQIGQQVNSFSISISDEMLKSLRMSRVGLHLSGVRAQTQFLPLFYSLKTMRSPMSVVAWSLTPTQLYLYSNRQKLALPPLYPYLNARRLFSNGNWALDRKSHSHIQR